MTLTQRTTELKFNRHIRRLLAALAVALIATFGEVGTARAGLVISAPTIAAAAGSSGSFDVVITNENPAGGDSFFVAGHSLDLALSGLPGVMFTDVTIATAIPYLFVLSGTTQGAGPLSLDSFPNTAFLTSDSEFASPGFAEIAPGKSFGIAHVSFSVGPNAASGDRGLILGAGTSLSDIAGAPVEFTTGNGMLSISAVPEPSAWLLLASGLVCSFVFRRRLTGAKRDGASE
jgi:PEP-CTERM motif